MSLVLPSEIVVERFVPTARAMLATALDERGFTQQEIADRIAEGFADRSMDGVDALAELLALVREFEDRGPICAVHEAEMPALEGMGCDLCVRGADSEVLAEREVLASVRRATRLLAGTDGMAAHVPNVGTNVGMALPDATTATDVAAIPGRIAWMRPGIAATSVAVVASGSAIPTFVPTLGIAATIPSAVDSRDRKSVV